MVYRVWIVLAGLVPSLAWGQAPAYSASSFVNSSNYSAGPFAPNSVLTVFGTNLAWSEHVLTAGDIAGNTLPTLLNGVGVYVDNVPAPLLYVAPAQINFIIPSSEIAGDVAVRVVREGVTGPEVTITLADAAPALFVWDGGYAVATHQDGSVITEDSPAHPGDTVVVYATGLGKIGGDMPPGAIPGVASQILLLSGLSVSLTGIDKPAYIRYAGVTPGCAGLYQINMDLPGSLGADPEIRVSVAGQSTPAGVKLLVR
jgi:uncharacterized protein (TIGR03437 family)